MCNEIFALCLSAGPSDGAVQELAHGRHRDERGKLITTRFTSALRQQLWSGRLNYIGAELTSAAAFVIRSKWSSP